VPRSTGRPWSLRSGAGGPKLLEMMGDREGGDHRDDARSDENGHTSSNIRLVWTSSCLFGCRRKGRWAADERATC
jgi:hypothetical protein